MMTSLVINETGDNDTVELRCHKKITPDKERCFRLRFLQEIHVGLHVC